MTNHQFKTKLFNLFLSKNEEEVEKVEKNRTAEPNDDCVLLLPHESESENRITNVIVQCACALKCKNPCRAKSKE